MARVLKVAALPIAVAELTELPTWVAPTTVRAVVLPELNWLTCPPRPPWVADAETELPIALDVVTPVPPLKSVVFSAAILFTSPLLRWMLSTYVSPP